MARPKVRFEILAEDAETAMFARKVLESLDVTRHEYHVDYCQAAGSGKKWVTDNCPRFVKSLRSRNYQRNLVLLVMTDADELTVAARCSQLEESLRIEGLSEREASDRIILWIPRWHVETWHLYFNGHSVNEVTRYKNEFDRHIKSNERKVSVDKFVDTYHSFLLGSSDPVLASLETAFRESQQIPL